MKVKATKDGQRLSVRQLAHDGKISVAEALKLKHCHVLNFSKKDADRLIDSGLAVKMEPQRAEVVIEAPPAVVTQVIPEAEEVVADLPGLELGVEDETAEETGEGEVS
jgi:hypothetical protein